MSFSLSLTLFYVFRHKSTNVYNVPPMLYKVVSRHISDTKLCIYYMQDNAKIFLTQIFSSPLLLQNNNADGRRNAGWGTSRCSDPTGSPWSWRRLVLGPSALRGNGGNGGSEEENKGHGMRGTAFTVFSGGWWRTSLMPARSGVGHQCCRNKQEGCHERWHRAELQREEGGQGVRQSDNWPNKRGTTKGRGMMNSKGQGAGQMWSHWLEVLWEGEAGAPGNATTNQTRGAQREAEVWREAEAL